MKENIKLLFDIKIPEPTAAYLTPGHKYPVRDELTEMEHLAHVEFLIHNLKWVKFRHTKQEAIYSLPLWYSKRMKKQRADPMVKKKNKIKAVHFGVGFYSKSREK